MRDGKGGERRVVSRVVEAINDRSVVSCGRDITTIGSCEDVAVSLDRVN